MSGFFCTLRVHHSKRIIMDVLPKSHFPYMVNPVPNFHICLFQPVNNNEIIS